MDKENPIRSIWVGQLCVDEKMDQYDKSVKLV